MKDPETMRRDELILLVETLQERHNRLIDRMINPPVCIAHIDFQKRWGEARREVKRFRRIFGNFYVRRER